MNMADRIKQRMQELDIKQEELGKAVGLTQPAIFKLLAGKTKRTTRLAEIAKALKVQPEWLSTGNGSMLANDEITVEDQEIIREIHTFPAADQKIVRMTLRAMLPALKMQLQMQATRVISAAPQER